MEKNLQGTEEVKEKKSNKKVIALVLVIVVLAVVIGVMFFTGSGGVSFFTETVSNPDQAADTLSDLGNDLGGITEDLKDMEDLL